MEILSSFGGDKHEFFVIVIKSKHVNMAHTKTTR